MSENLDPNLLNDTIRKYKARVSLWKNLLSIEVMRGTQGWMAKQNLEIAEKELKALVKRPADGKKIRHDS